MSEMLLLVDRVSVQFGGLRALSDVDFKIGKRELVALIGPNGAGKTTLLNVLGGEIKPTPGVEWRTLAICLSTLWPGS